VSTKSITNTVRRTEMNPQVRAPVRLNFMKMGPMDGGMAAISVGSCAVFVAKAAAVMVRIPMRRAPFVFLASRNIMRKSPAMESSVGVLPMSPRVTGAPGEPSVTMPVSLSPMKQRKSPIPTAKAIFKPGGTDFASQLRAPARVSMVKRTPPMKMAPRAVCHE